MFNKLRYLIGILHQLKMFIINDMPGEQGYRIRYNYWKKKLKHLGIHVRIDTGVYFQHPHFITIDDNCWIDRNVIILAGKPGSERITFYKHNQIYKGKIGEVYIGKNTHIAPNCVLSGIGGLFIGQNCGIASNSTIYSFSHHYRNLTNTNDSYQYSFTPLARQDQQSMILGPVVIEDYCAVGLNSILLPGTCLMKGTWLSCGSVVSERFTSQTLVSTPKKNQTKNIGNLKIKE